MKDIFIYGLVDPFDFRIKYVGATNNLKIRYRQHLINTNNKSTRKDKWINDLIKLGVRPSLVILNHSFGDEEEKYSLEKKYYEIFQDILLNEADLFTTKDSIEYFISIRKKLRENNIKLKIFAKEIDINYGYVSSILNGNGPISFAKYKLLKTKMDTAVDKLIKVV